MVGVVSSPMVKVESKEVKKEPGRTKHDGAATSPTARSNAEINEQEQPQLRTPHHVFNILFILGSAEWTAKADDAHSTQASSQSSAKVQASELSACVFIN